MYKRTKQQQQQGKRRYLQPDTTLAKDTSMKLVDNWNEPLKESKDADIEFDSFLVAHGVKLC